MMGKNAKTFLNKKLLYLIPILIVVLVFVARFYLGTMIEVSGKSMEPTFRTSDYILTKKVYIPSEIKKDDIVIFVPNSGSCKGQQLVKRVVALPNTFMMGEDGAPNMELGDNEYYVMGDNRDNSIDSRDFGPIGIETIKYKYVGFKIPQITMDILIVLVAVSITMICYVCYGKGKEKERENKDLPEQN